MNWRSIDYRILVGLGVLAFFCLALLYALEIPYFNRYFSFTSFIVVSVVFGLLLGGFAAWRWGSRMKEPYDRMRLWVGLLVAGILFGPLFLSLLNRHVDPWPSYWENVELVEVEARLSSRYGLPDPEEMPESNSYHLYFYRNARLTRMVFQKKPDLGDTKKGDLIGVKIRRGLFGLEWVQAVRPEGPNII